jgi:hypothetical protein
LEAGVFSSPSPDADPSDIKTIRKTKDGQLAAIIGTLTSPSEQRLSRPLLKYSVVKNNTRLAVQTSVGFISMGL